MQCKNAKSQVRKPKKDIIHAFVKRGLYFAKRLLQALLCCLCKLGDQVIHCIYNILCCLFVFGNLLLQVGLKRCTLSFYVFTLILCQPSLIFIQRTNNCHLPPLSIRPLLDRVIVLKRCSGTPSIRALPVYGFYKSLRNALQYVGSEAASVSARCWNKSIQ